EDGVRAVREQRPDAVVLDVRLPDMTGPEAFDRIKALDPRLLVVILTASKAVRGAFEYLLKPVDLHQLREVIGRAAELRRRQGVPAVIGGDPLPPNRLDVFCSPDVSAADPEVCNCHHVTESTLVGAIRDGCTSLPQLSAATRAGTGCGSCRGQLARLILKTSPRPADVAVNGTGH